ncbi:MAG: hypothetical protein ABJG15_08545 [Hyphomonadaceae bacterium]
MTETVAIDDIVEPLRAYAWAVTGSVGLADQLLISCFETIGNMKSGPLPNTQGDWFGHLDNVVVDWVASGQGAILPEHCSMVETAKMIEGVKKDVLWCLLDHSGSAYTGAGKART